MTSNPSSQPNPVPGQAKPSGQNPPSRPNAPTPAPVQIEAARRRIEPNHVILLMAAAVTTFGAIIAYLQVQANSQASRFNRDGQVQAVLSLQNDIEANLLYNFESDRLRNVAVLQNTAALYNIYGDETKSEQLDSAAQGLITGSGLFQAPYYDPESGFFPDLNAYYHDQVSRPYFLARETREATLIIGKAWLNKGNAYQTIITLTAVTLFLYGLSLALEGCIKFGFVGLGTVNLGFVGLWALITLLVPIPTMPTEAIAAYAEGEIHVSRAFNLEYWSDYEEVPTEVELANEFLSTAIEQKDDFEAAYVARADAKLVLGESYLLNHGDFTAVEEALQDAVVDYRTAIEIEPDNYHTLWNLGWTLYLLGEYQNALDTFDKVLILAPQQQFGANLDRAMNLLGMGEKDKALEATYNAILRAAARPSSDDIYYYRQAIRNLHRFREIFNHDGMSEMEIMLKEAFVSVQHRGAAEPGATTSQISRLAFFDPFSGDEGQSFTGVEVIGVRFAYTDLKPGEQVLLKVYYDDFEQAYMKQVILWDGSANGVYANFTIQGGVEQRYNPLGAGRYEVEIYVEGNLMASAVFEITP